MTLDDGADTAVVNVADVSTSINGGPGKDTITGSDGGADAIDGAGDEDTVNGRGGDDSLLDGIADARAQPPLRRRGRRRAAGRAGADQLDGGDGFDTATYADRGTDAASGVSVVLAGGAATGAGAPGENDTLAASRTSRAPPRTTRCAVSSPARRRALSEYLQSRGPTPIAAVAWQA